MFLSAVLTVSDRGYAGERVDTAGPAAVALLRDAGYEVMDVEIVPDEQPLIEAALIRLADEKKPALILTTGGTGFSARDITPEATQSVCERMVPGIPEAMRAFCMPITNRAMLSRGVAGIRGRTLIINLPGSPKAVKENLSAVLPTLEHGLQMLCGAQADCAAETGNHA